jgi:hypothetical protein
MADEALGIDAMERVDNLSRWQEAQACGGGHSPVYLRTHGVHIASMHAGEIGEFKPEYVCGRPALAELARVL